MKKLLAAIASTFFLVTANACWINEENFNGCYLAGVNNYVAHYTEVSELEDAVWKNGQQVSLPITVWVKVGPRVNSDGELMPIIKAVLQYRILPGGKWKTVKTVTNKAYDIAWAVPVALFGKNNIDPNISAGTAILIRVYLTDGVYETGDLDDNLDGVSIPNTIRYGSPYMDLGTWKAPFVFKVIYNGKRTK